MSCTRLEFNREKLTALRTHGRLKTVELCFDSFNETKGGKYRLSLSRGYPVYLAGEPHHGKSTFTYELLMQLSERHGYKHFCYFGEAGYPEDVYAELCELYIGKHFSSVYNGTRENPYAMSENERMQAEHFVNEHFYILPVENRMTADHFYKALEVAQTQYGVTFDTAVIDPIYDLDDFEAREKSINQLLKKINRHCFESQRIDFVVNHVSEPDRQKETNKRLPAKPDQWYGGKVWFRRAFLQLLIHRPTPRLSTVSDERIEENEAHIYVQKAKPNGIGTLGQIKLFFDWRSKRYYEVTPAGYENYAKSSRLYKEKEKPKKVEVQTITASPSEAFGEDVMQRKGVRTIPVSSIDIETDENEEEFPF